MITSFELMPDHAKTWVYQCNRALSKKEEDWVLEKVHSFLKGWAAHGKDLQAAADLRYNRFLLLAVDESANMATGCSIDSSVGFIKQMQNELNVDFFDRTNIAFSTSGVIESESLKVFKEKVKSGQIPESATIFNNTITTKGELLNNWMQPLTKSWAGRFLPSTV